MTSEPPNPAPGDGAPHDDTTSPETPVAAETAVDALPVAAPETAIESEAPETGIDGAPPLVVEPVVTGTAPRRGIGTVGYLLAGLAGVAIAVGALALSGSLSILEPTPSPSPSPDPSPSPAAYVEGRWLGDADAPVTLEIWADFQCPYCGLQARAVTPSIERLYAAEGRVRMTFRDFAFLGEESFGAAVAARCAGQQGAFWYFHDLLFASQQGENQGAFADDNLQGLAQFAGLDLDAFTTCTADPAVRAEVEAETAKGRELGVSSTPVIRIEGPGGLQVVTGLKPLSELEAAIERAEQPAPSASPVASAGSSGSPAPSPSASAGSSASPAPSPSGNPAPSPSGGASPAPSSSGEASPSP